MIKKLCFTVKGKPESWKRPNYFKGRYLKGKGDRSNQAYIAACARSQNVGKVFFTGPVELIVRCYFKRPKKKCLEKYKITRGDIDNYQKAVFDSLNSVVYKDDAQIVVVHAYKLYTDDDERIEVELFDAQ